MTVRYGLKTFVETRFAGCNVGYVVTDEGIVMIDTPQHPTDAAAWRDEIRQKGLVRFIIITEPHRDHWSGIPFFDGSIVSLEGARVAISSGISTGSAIRLPDVTFKNDLSIYVGGTTFHLMAMPGHTPFELAVHIPEEKVVFTSDNVFCRVQAWLHESLPYEWLESLKKLQELTVDVVIPGHGEVCDLSYIPEMTSFIQEWINVVQNAIQRGDTVDKACDEISFKTRYPMQAGTEHLVDDVQLMNVRRLYAVLESRRTERRV